MAKKKRKSIKSDDPIEKELVTIKRLLIALLYKLGAQRDEVAFAIEMDPSDLSKMMPARKIKSIIESQK